MPPRILNLFSRFKWYLLVIALTVPTFTVLLRPGYFPMHDDISVFRIYEMGLCFKDGQIPCRWIPDMGYRYGYPQFEYYGPLPYYVMTAANLLGVSLFGAVKLGFILPMIFGGVTMFLLAASLFGNWGGLLSAIAYTYLPFRASDIYSRGAMGETWAFVFIPLILFALLKLYQRPNLKTSALLALAYAALLTTHNITTLIFSPLVGLTALLLLIGKRNKLIIIKYGFLALLWSILAAGFFFLPLLFEQGYAHTKSLISGYFNYLAHFVSLKQLFFTTFWGYGSSEIGPTDDLPFFVGPVHLFLAIIAGFVAGRNYITKKPDLKQGLVVLSFIFVLVSLFLTHERSSFIWESLPFLAYLQFPWRFLITANFFIALMAGYIVINLSEKAAKITLVVFGFLLIFMNVSYFRPRLWLDLTIWEKFSGVSWDRQLTTSIFDYLPIYAKYPPAAPAPIFADAINGKVSFLDYIHQTDSFSFTTKGNSGVTLVLPQYDFPGWQVNLDGKKISHRHDNPLGLISFEIPAGEHRVRAKLTNTPIRLFGNLATLLAVPFAIYTLTKKRK